MARVRVIQRDYQSICWGRFRVEEMKSWTVSNRVGNVRNSDPTLVEAIT
jgi:hypothetical protein